MSSRVLVVDDEATILEFVNRVLTGAGYETTLASSGEEGLAAVMNQGPFDLLLTDQVMPLMTGDELAARARKAYPDLKVLYLTGFNDHLFRAKTLLWDDEAFLDKPCSANGLVEAVSLLLYGRLSGPPAPPAATART